MKRFLSIALALVLFLGPLAVSGFAADEPITKKQLDDAVKSMAEAFGWTYVAENYTTAMGIYTSGLGAQLTWTLPFGLLITFAIFNRFDRRFEEAARDLGATPWQSFAHVVLPIIAPSVIGIGLFGFTLSWDEVARSSQAMGDSG